MNDFQQTFPASAGAYGPQLAPQGFFGGLLGAPLGGMIGRGVGGLFGNAGLGAQIGQAAGGIGGAFLPFGADPMMAGYAQHQAMQQAMQPQYAPLAPQGFFGNLLGQVGQPLGGAIGGLFGQPGLGSAIGGAAGQIGRLLPFNVDPMMAAYAQQQMAGAYPGYFAGQGGQQGAMYGAGPQTLH